MAKGEIMAKVLHMYLIGGTAGRSRNYTDPQEIAAEWVRRDDPATTIRFVLADGTTSHGTLDQVKPVWDAMEALR